MNNDDLLDLVTAPITDADDLIKKSYKVVARGELDLLSAAKLTETLDSLTDGGATMIVLDATDIEFLDSSGLRAIVRSGNRLSDRGGHLFIEGMSGAVKRVLEISGLIEQYQQK